ncbi:MAG TPA: hypothetical protein VFI96_05155 [Longimicrobiaceae bacterium]|nr:hypothetical protein [Longimicrobiaceae bacterium]
MSNAPDPTPPVGEGGTLEERLRSLSDALAPRGNHRAAVLTREAAEELARLRAENERLTAERERTEERVREAYRTVSARVAERDALDNRLSAKVVEQFDARLALAETLGMVDVDGIPPDWSTMVARVNELRTTLRARRTPTSEGADR